MVSNIILGWLKTGVNISISSVTGVAEDFFGSHAKIFILVFFVQKYSFGFFSCKNISVSIIHDSNLFTPTRQGNLYRETFMCSLAKIFTRNGRKGRFKAVMQKYSQKMAGKHCFKEIVQKYSFPATHRGRTPMKKYYLGWCRIIHFKINIHPWGLIQSKRVLS